MLKYVFGAVGVGVAFMVWCCCKVASEEDRRMEALYRQEIEQLRDRRDAS